jgi:hypothetical protein
MFETVVVCPVLGVEVVGGERDAGSPVVHVRLSRQPGSGQEDAKVLLQRIIDTALKRSSVLFAVHRVSPLDKIRTQPSIRCVLHTAAVALHGVYHSVMLF